MDKDKLDKILLIVQILTLLVQIASLIALVIYVRKTSQMASATNDMAQATKRSAETAEDMAAASKRSAEVAEKTLDEIKESRDLEAAPYVVAYFDAMPSSHLIYLVVKNIGKTVANSVKLEFNPPLQSGNKSIKIAEIPLIKEGIGSIPPGYEIKTLLDSAISYFGQKTLPLTYLVKISYSGGLRPERRFIEQTLDLHALEGLILANEKGMPELVKQTEEVSKSLSSASKELQRMAESLESGIWLRNTDIFLPSSESGAASWHLHLLAKLNEFKLVWTSTNKDRREIFSSGVQNRCILIGQQLLMMLSNLPNAISREAGDLVIDITSDLFKLGRFQFYIDGGDSDKKFIKLGDEVVRRIDIAIGSLGSKSNQAPDEPSLTEPELT